MEGETPGWYPKGGLRLTSLPGVAAVNGETDVATVTDWLRLPGSLAAEPCTSREAGAGLEQAGIRGLVLAGEVREWCCVLRGAGVGFRKAAAKGWMQNLGSRLAPGPNLYHLILGHPGKGLGGGVLG